jgi:lamin tail-like protein/CotH protein
MRRLMNVLRCARVPILIGCIAWTLSVSGQSFTLVNVGSSPTVPTQSPVPGGADVTAGGIGVQAASDQFAFAYELRTGDFDLAVRVANVTLPDAWSQAGLMARGGVTVNAPFAAALSSPGPAGSYFSARTSTGGSVRTAGWFPANYPDTWLRLQRTVNQFTGYASFDGQNWEFLGTTNIAMPATINVGLALGAGVSNAVASAQFRDYANASGFFTTNQIVPFEPLGPSSRRTALVFTEIMYNPPDAWSTNNLQFVELYNSGTVPEDLTGHRLTGDIGFTFPPATTLSPGQFLIVAKDPAAASAFYGVTALGPFTGNLPNSGGTLRLVSEVGGRLLEVEYDNKWPWPVAADGAGHSLELWRPSYGENSASAWSASDSVGGTPGRAGHFGGDATRSVVINEFLAHTDLPEMDFIELYNHGNFPVDLSGCYLSDKLDTNRFQFPNPTIIPARGFLMLDELDLGFRLNAAGGKIVLRNAALTRVLDAVNYDAQENSVACGRWPDGADRWSRLAVPTPGLSNAPVRLENVVLNEVMYDPITGDDHDQYLELHNPGGVPAALAGWKIKGGVEFTFPTNTMLAPGGFMVVAKDTARLLANYPQLNATNLIGNFSGKLSGKTERITLSRPDVIIGTNDLGVWETNLVSIVVDEVTYANGGRWPQFANGGGSSMELIDPRADRRQPASWRDSDESQKAPWTTVDLTSVLENGQGGVNRFEFFLADNGEVLVDEIEFRNNGGVNLIANAGFESGATGYTLNGTHRRSFVENGTGLNGSRALHVIATGRGDAGPNKVFANLSAVTVGSPNTGTIRAKVRWLRGSRHLLFRPNGHWMEATPTLSVPANLGTPGLVNSRRVSNAGPAIYEVKHNPVLPAALQPVVVSARVQDPDGPGTLTLSYRVDPSSVYSNASMRDDGTSGDAVANDGVYSATIPGQTAGKLAAFRIIAADALAVGNIFPPESPTNECLVRWGEPIVAGTLGTYRIWITEATRSAWAARERNANDPLDCTFVYGNNRAIYDAGTLYSGSPFHTLFVGYNGPTGITCDYELNFRKDEKFLGAEDFVLSAIDTAQGGTFFPDPSAQVEITGNWIMRKLGQPSNHKRHVHLYVNGLRRGTVYEDSQQPNNELVEEFFPDDEHGELRKVEDWFEFDNGGSSFNYVTATVQQFTRAAGGIDTKRYRWNWRPRATDNPDDWTSFTNLITAMNTAGTGPLFVNNVRQRVDARRWLGPIAVHHLCGDWDSYGYQRGKNMFAYRSDNGLWGMLMWDIELCLGNSQSSVYTESIYMCHDPVLQKMLNGAPAFQREYLGLMLDALNGPFAPGAANALLDARYSALLRNGLAVGSPDFIKTYIANRRAFVLPQIPVAQFLVLTPAPSPSPNVVFGGSAPINVRTITADGKLLTLNWSSVAIWSSSLLLPNGTNLVEIIARDFAGNVVGSTNITMIVTAPTPWPPLRINEWMASNTGSSLDPADDDADDWFEIYNPTATNVALANWTLTDNPTNEVRYVVPAGYAVPANGYLLVWADDETQQNTNIRPDLHVDFKLDKAGEAIALFAPDGTLVDQVTFGTQTNDVTEGRWRDGEKHIETLLEPTPGQANVGVTPYLSVSLVAGQPHLTFNTIPGSTYLVQWTTNLALPSWTSLQPAAEATNSLMTLIDTNSAAIQKYYRAVLSPLEP